MRTRFLIPMVIVSSFLFVGLITNGLGSGTGPCDCPGVEQFCTTGDDQFCGDNLFCDQCGCISDGYPSQCVVI